jgi:hypothetical protein
METEVAKQELVAQEDNRFRSLVAPEDLSNERADTRSGDKLHCANQPND